jgi:hypothetical protein
VTAQAHLGQLLERDGDLELPTLSDDELAALFPLAPPRALLVPLASHDGLSADERSARAVAGEESLLGRGLLAEDGDGVRPTEELRAILAVRDAPLTVMLVDVVEGGDVRSRYAYGLGGEAFVLTETVDGDAHAFALRTPAGAAAALADEIDRDARAAKSDGRPLVRTADDEPRSWAKVEAALAAPERTIRLFAAQRISETEVRDLETSIVVAATGVWLLAGEVDAATGKGSVTARQLSRAGLEELLRTFMVR